MATIQIPPVTGNGPSTPVGDTVTVSSTRVHNAAQPLVVVPAPSYAGSADGRNWGNWFVEGLTGPTQGLYQGVPTVFEHPSIPGQLHVEFVYLKNGDTSETALAGVNGRNMWAGERGDNVVNPMSTLIDTPRAVPTDPTVLTGIDLSGWMFHVLPNGRVVTMCGPSLPAGLLPTLGGGRKTVSGTFPDGAFNGPNDLCYDPGNPLIIYVADTFNDRIAKVHETAPGVVNITTYYTGGLTDPYSLYAEADGTLIVADRANNRVIRIPQVGGPGGTAGVPVNIATGLSEPMVVRPFSDGNICCAEHGGTRRLLEITRATGALREIDRILTPQGVQTTAWIWMDVDAVGTCGPVNDIFTTIFSTYQTLKRVSRDGTFKSFIQTGSYLPHGKLTLAHDPLGHYPWALGVSRRFAEIYSTGGGSSQIRKIRRIHAQDVTTVDGARFKRGVDVWRSLGDQTKPSIWLNAGRGGGHNFLGLENTETLDAMSWTDFAAWIRGGGNGSVPRALTDAQVQDARYYVKRNARRGLVDATVDSIGHLAPPPGEPAPEPPAPTVTRLVAAGISYVLTDIVPDPPDPPDEPDPPLPPPGNSDLDPGVWTQLVVATRTVDQPRLIGSQSIAEGSPGEAESIAPNPVAATGTMFRSYSGTTAGGGKVYSWGGGHAGHPGNDLDILDIATGIWTKPFSSECPEPYIAGVPNAQWRTLKGGGAPFTGLSPTGRPFCKHAYRHMAVDTERDRLLLVSGNGLGAFAQDGTWTQLSGVSKALREVTFAAAGSIIYDPVRDSVWAFMGDSANGLDRGIYEYSMAADVWRFVQAWTAFTGWSFSAKIITAHYAPQTRDVFLITSPAGGAIPEFPNRLFRYNLDSGAMVWEISLVPGVTAYNELLAADGKWNRFADFRTESNQLYCYTAAWGTVAAGFWVFSPTVGSGGTWTKQLTPDGPGLAWWSLSYDAHTDTFVGLRARTLYCGIAQAACGGIADTHLFKF